MKTGYTINHCGYSNYAVCATVFNYESANEICSFYYSDIMFASKNNSGKSIGRWKLKALKQ